MVATDCASMRAAVLKLSFTDPRHLVASQSFLLHFNRSRSRGAFLRPSCTETCPLENRGHGECRELAAPMARQRKKMLAAGTTGSAETSRHSPRNGWNGCFAFSPVLRAFWPPSSALRIAHQRPTWHQRRDARTTRLDRAHRRRSSAWANPRCNIDTPTASRLNVRDDREAPLM